MEIRQPLWISGRDTGRRSSDKKNLGRAIDALLLTYPSAWIPLVFSLAMLVVFGLSYAGVIPPAPIGDEGTVHLFQI